MGILLTKRSMVRAMYGVQLKDRKRLKDLVFILNELVDQWTLVNSVGLYGHVMRGEDGHVLRWALDIRG